MPFIYLAGPQVFRPDALAQGAHLKAVCAQSGLTGLYPLDGAASEGENAHTIRARCIDLLDAADAVVADISPFRGPHMDPGTAWEIGYAQARGLKVHLWSRDPRHLRARIPASLTAHGWRDKAGDLVEDFGQPENLMICAPDAPVHPNPETAIAVAAESLVHPPSIRAQTGRGLVFMIGLAMMAALLASLTARRLMGW